MGDSRSMAVGALLRCWCVEENQPSADFLPRLMTTRARHILVRAPEFEIGLVVVEAGRTPESGVVARRAVLGFARQPAELAEVNVFVAVGTLAERSVAVDDSL